MYGTLMTVAAAAAGAVALMALIILRGRSEQKTEFEKNVKSSWGSKIPRLYLPEQLSALKSYARSECPSGASAGETAVTLDEITAADLQMDDIFCRVSRTLSSPGDEVLLHWLLHPLTSREELRHRIDLEEYFLSHPDERKKVQAELADAGRLRGDSYYGAMRRLAEAEPIGQKKYVLLSAVTLGLFVLLFVNPLAAVVLMIPDLYLNIRVHLRMKKKTEPYLRGFRCILRLLKVSDRIRRLNIPELADETRRMEAASGAFSEFRRGSLLVASAGAVGTGLGDAVLEYVKMFFHVDLIFFDKMLRSSREHTEEATELLDVVGTLDAAISAASYRTSLTYSCRPEISDPGENVSLKAEAMYHPLLAENAVDNSIETERPILLTGSNASGKSTFLKGIALCAVLGQSIGVVPAKAYRAPMFRIFTSMALTDNLLGGESYFIVEIRSLKRIMDAADEGETPVLAMVDEVLRGTNTIERIAASSQILRSFARPGLLTFAATHDIELTGLLEDVCRNMHFAETVEDGDVRFDYRLREGRSETRNAIRLLKEAGYPGETVENAEKSVEHFEKTGDWVM